MPLKQEKIIDCIAACLISSVDELTALDAAIGDADHGINMRRGAEALLAQRHSLAAMPAHDALYEAGLSFASSVGGASGALYGSFLMAMGKSGKPMVDSAGFAEAVAAGVSAVERLGHVELGQKTMLDVLKPVALHLASGAATFQSIRALASEAAAATVPMIAMRGRAAYLRERSVGHMDPGARSSELIVIAVLQALESGQ